MGEDEGGSHLPAQKPPVRGEGREGAVDSDSITSAVKSR